MTCIKPRPLPGESDQPEATTLKNYTLHQRRRKPSSAELAGIPWLQVLQPGERELAVGSIQVGDAQPGNDLCRVGRPVT